MNWWGTSPSGVIFSNAANLNSAECLSKWSTKTTEDKFVTCLYVIQWFRWNLPLVNLAPVCTTFWLQIQTKQSCHSYRLAGGGGGKWPSLANWSSFYHVRTCLYFKGGTHSTRELWLLHLKSIYIAVSKTKILQMGLRCLVAFSGIQHMEHIRWLRVINLRLQTGWTSSMEFIFLL